VLETVYMIYIIIVMLTVNTDPSGTVALPYWMDEVVSGKSRERGI
jgi:hypothetical protein